MPFARSRAWMFCVFAWTCWKTLDAGGLALVRADAYDEARILFEAGVAASRAERWLEAGEYFRRSLSLAEKPSSWFNLAVVEVKQGHGEAGLAALDAFDRLANPRDHGELMVRAQALRVQAAALPPVEVEPPARATSAESTTSEPEKAALPETTELATTASPLPPPELPALRPARTLLGVGVGTLVGSVAALGWWRQRVTAHGECEADLARCTNLSQLETQERAALGVSIATAAVSVGLMAASAAWLVREKRYHHRVRVSLQTDMDVARRAGALRLALRF